MRKYLLSFMVVFLIIFTSLGYAEENSVSGAFTVDVMSQYIWRGIDETDSAVVQPDLSITYKDFTIDFWADYDAGGTSDVDEVDITFDYSPTFKVGPGEFTPSIGYIYYQLEPSAGGDTQEIYAGVGYSVEVAPEVGLNISTFVYRDVDTVHSTYVEGTLGLDVSVKPVTVSPYVTASYYSYDHGKNDWNNVELGTDISFPLVGPLSGHTLIAYSFGNDDMGLGDEFYGGIGISFEF